MSVGAKGIIRNIKGYYWKYLPKLIVNICKGYQKDIPPASQFEDIFKTWKYLRIKQLNQLIMSAKGKKDVSPILCLKVF